MEVKGTGGRAAQVRQTVIAGMVPVCCLLSNMGGKEDKTQVASPSVLAVCWSPLFYDWSCLHPLTVNPSGGSCSESLWHLV